MPAANLPARWQWRPVQVLVSSELSPDCQNAVARAVDFWAEQGADYLIPQTLDAYDPRLLAPTLGTITVTGREPVRETAAADTNVAAVGGIMASADVRLGRVCNLWHAAHELGHAIGLADLDDVSNVMHRSNVVQSFQVSDAQRERIK